MPEIYKELHDTVKVGGSGGKKRLGAAPCQDAPAECRSL